MSGLWADVAYNWGPTLESFVVLKGDPDVLKTSVINIVMTRFGERVMRPEFGSLVPSTLFEQNDPSLVSRIESSVRGAIARWDDRIEVLELKAEAFEHRLDIKVVFRNAKDPAAEAQRVLIELAATGGPV